MPYVSVLYSHRIGCWLAVLVLIGVLTGDVPALTAAPGTLAWSEDSRPQGTDAAPDLVIESMTLKPLDPPVERTWDIEVVVKNQGDAATTGAFNLYLYEPADTPPKQGTDFTTTAGYAIPLPAGATFKYTRTGQEFKQSPPVVYAWVDPPWENAVTESDENNNLFPQPTADDDYEDDDLCSQAKTIEADGTAQERNLNRNPDSDVDWIKFDGVSGVTYLAEAIAVGADASLVIELKGSCDGPPSFGNGAKIEFTAPADGTYYIKITHTETNYGPDNAYQFKVTGDTVCTNLLEPDNVCSLAGELPLETQQTRNFCKADDTDWMRFSVIAGAEYKVTSANVGQKANVKLGLFMKCEDANNTASGQSLQFTAPETGQLFIKAEQTDGTLHGADTEYTLQVERLGGEGCTEDSFEQDDTANDAKTIETDGSSQSRNVCPADDDDWVAFSASSGTTYNIETFNLAAAADTLLCLHASNGDQLVCDDDNGAGRGSRLIWSPPTSATYLLHIEDVSARVAGEETRYELRIRQGLCEADVFEEDDSLNAATVLTVDDGPTAHNFCPEEDEDWFAFVASGGKSYIIDTLDPGPEADTLLELYDADENLLAQNDDHTPGTVSQVAYTTASSGNLFVKVRQYNPRYFGTGTEYKVRVREGTPTPTPTVTATPTPTPTPTPNPSQVRTLIMVNRTRLVQLHNESQVSQLMTKLEELVRHDQVQGEIIRLDNNAQVSSAYAAWTVDQGNVQKANQVTAAIRTVVLTYLSQRSGIEYLVLVGDDRALPMRRILDTTPRFSESSYKHTDVNNPSGAALKGNYYLSDDYFADKEPTTKEGLVLFIPDLAVGRLIESPADMIVQIDAFLANPVTQVDDILISGYDFVQDVASGDCEDWKADFDANKVDCSLIGASWNGQTFRSLQLRTTSPFRVQSISGHATHYAEGAPVGNAILAQEVAGTNFDLAGGLIYTPGCHAGLNLPPNNPDNPIDLPQVFTSKGANYIGNTGYGWGLRSSIGLSEKVVRLYTRALLQGTQSSMGKALMTAKTLYYQQDQDFSSYDEKVMQQFVFYGLPMYELESGGVLSPGDEFPGVSFSADPPADPLGETDVLTGLVAIDFTQAQNLELSETENGDYFSLSGSIHAVPGQPIQPLHFGDITAPNLPARNVLLLSASFETQGNFDPAIAVPYNEYDIDNLEPELENPLGLYPPVPVSVQEHNGRSNLVTQLGQYDAATKELRLYQNVEVEVYYSLATDEHAPEATIIDGIAPLDSSEVLVKVGAVDGSGVKRVLLSYIQDINQGVNRLQSKDLTYDAESQKWIGSFEGGVNSRFLVQIVDGAGNVTTATNKGRYYTPGQVRTTPTQNGCTHCIYLPLTER